MKPARNSWRPYLLAVFTALFLLSCSAARPMPPEVNLAGLSLEGVTLSQADLNARLRVFNPNRIALTIEQLDYILLLDGIKISEGQSHLPARIGAKDHGELNVRLSAPYLALWQVLSGLATSEEVQFSLDGSVKIGGLGIVNMTFPIQRQGTVSLKNLALR
jgi:LEA14-like dessication related protein